MGMGSERLAAFGASGQMFYDPHLDEPGAVATLRVRNRGGSYFSLLFGAEDLL